MYCTDCLVYLGQQKTWRILLQIIGQKNCIVASSISYLFAGFYSSIVQTNFFSQQNIQTFFFYPYHLSPISNSLSSWCRKKNLTQIKHPLSCNFATFTSAWYFFFICCSVLFQNSTGKKYKVQSYLQKPCSLSCIKICICMQKRYIILLFEFRIKCDTHTCYFSFVTVCFFFF